MKIKLLDGSVKDLDQSLSVGEFAKSLGNSLGKATIGAILNQKVFVATDFVLDQDYEVELITDKSGTNYDFVQGTTAAAISAYALTQLFSDVQISQNFYKADELEFAFTFVKPESLKLDQLNLVQAKVNEVLKAQLTIQNRYVKNLDDVQLNEYQTYLATQKLAQDGFVALTKINDQEFFFNEVVAIEPSLTKIIQLEQLTGSYWLDDAKNVMLQRIHGLVATSQTLLEQKQSVLEDQRSRDHRSINKLLDIFYFDNLIGAGLPIWLPNGTILKDEIKKYLKDKEWEYDYIQIQTPVIGTLDLYKTSGHLDHYRDDMFQPFKGGNEEFVLKPMSCPHHIAVYRQQQRSYRDLPLRYAEHALQHRYESSGSLTGLERVRAMELTDSHIFVRPDQIEAEFKSIYQLISEVLETFKIKIDYLSFSVRDPQDKEKYFDNDQMWNEAEETLEQVLKDLKIPYKKMVGEAAFYGPKLDIQFKTAQNHEITVSTIQLDFLLPQKFNLTYIDSDGQEARPIMIHRGLIGTYERFIAILLEQTRGNLPLWLAPKQIEIIPVGDETNIDYAREVQQKLKKLKIRTHLDLRDERLSYKIRDAQVHKIPYQLVLGPKEKTDKTLTYRQYGNDSQTTVGIDEFVQLILKEIETKN